MTDHRQKDWLRGIYVTVTGKKINAIFIGTGLSIILHKVGVSEAIQIIYATAILGAVGVQGYRDVKTPKAPDAE